MTDDLDPDEQALIEAALADPTSDGGRMIYADWLEERGDRRADFLRLEAQVRMYSARSPRRWELQEQLQALMRHATLAWLARFDRTHTRSVVDLSRRAGARYREIHAPEDRLLVVTANEADQLSIESADNLERISEHLIWESQGMILLVHQKDAAWFAGSLVDSDGDRIYWCHPPSMPSTVSVPGGLRLSPVRLRSLFPESFSSIAIFDESQSGDMQSQIFNLAIHLATDDAQAAVVAQLSPLLVAAYAEELDCVAMLEFPEHLVAEHNLSVGMRLVALNCYSREDAGRDLRLGPAHTRQYTDFQAHIGDFLSDDALRLAALRAYFRPSAWERANELARLWQVSPPGAPRPGIPNLHAPYCW